MGILPGRSAADAAPMTDAQKKYARTLAAVRTAGMTDGFANGLVPENFLAGRNVDKTTGFDAGALTQEQLDGALNASRRRMAASAAINSPSTTDFAIRDISSGRITRARRGSGSASLIGAFDPTAPLGNALIGGA